MRHELTNLNIKHREFDKLLRKYDAMPDMYYPHTAEVGPVKFGHPERMAELGYRPGQAVNLWEWMAGSATLSTHARQQGVPHLPPIDHRWAFHMARINDQEKLMYSQLVYGCDVLFASPTCTPWGGHSRGWDPSQRRAQRMAQGTALEF